MSIEAITMKELYERFDMEIRSIADLAGCTALRERWLSRERGLVSTEFKRLGALPKEQRPEQGKQLNELKNYVETALYALQERLEQAEAQARLRQERVDVTLPGYPYALGKSHPLRLVREEIESILIRMGFSALYTPELESELYNFDALNFPKDHPAKDAQDSFYVGENLLLRT
ncbi:MAG: phenylalanine--tRNA ligase subunit alpha, partial [Acidobacteria bacterium]|nr:phenylalanine--tRNA ligase subunit alpha [Acidobacteriota bacterium]